MPIISVSVVEERVCFELLTSLGWQPVAADALPETTPFSRHVAVLPDSECSFRSRLIPAELISEKDLDEAIALDIEQWSPFSGLKLGAGLSSVSFVERHQEQWQVAVWIWPTSVEKSLLALLPDGFQVTHILPGMAWLASLSSLDAPSLICHVLDAHHGYALVSSKGVPVSVVWLDNELDDRRFWKAMGTKLNNVKQVLYVGDQTAAWQPDCIPSSQMKMGVPQYRLLNRSRRLGVRDWADPISWLNPIMTFALLLLVWGVADAAVLIERNSAVASELAEMQQGTQKALSLREKVAVLHQYLQDVQDVHDKQFRVMSLIAELTQRVASDIWIDVLQLEGDKLDIRCQGKDVARLLVELEKIKSVHKVLLVSDIQPNNRTGLEVVQLRLILKDKGEAEHV